MKHIAKTGGRIAALFLFALIAAGCNKWLDGALPKDKNLDDQQFSTERGINSVMNGIYRSMSSENLYGGKLTMTDVELLAHYYYYDANLGVFPEFTYFHNISTYRTDELRGAFTSAWRESYALIFRINAFIDNLSPRDSAVISRARKNVLLGEARALRAFLHFDLFRLFAPTLSDDEPARAIPYNRSPEVIPHEALQSDKFFDLLMDDIDAAVSLLGNDPVITEGIKHTSVANDAAQIEAADIFASYMRNRRMNYYAARALKARMLMYRGKPEDVRAAADLAQKILDESFGAGKTFSWTNPNRIEELKNRDYIFYSEILFGIHNQNLHTSWNKWTGGSRQGSTYTVSTENLQNNIFRHDKVNAAMSQWEDARVLHWIPSKTGGGNYVSIKFEQFDYSEGNPREYFQPLMRTAELFLIIAEARLRENLTGEAAKLIYELRGARGRQIDPDENLDNLDASTVESLLETEYYKEFYGEGQSFFFLKRRESGEIFNVAASGKETMALSSYAIPIPESELAN
jgi:hypothetical protein